MIITRLMGGLGNQMFQYAAGLALAEHHRTSLKLDLSWYDGEHLEYPAPHNRYALSCFNILEQFATEEEVVRCSGKGLSHSEKTIARLARTLRLPRIAHLLRSSGKTYDNEKFFVRDPDFLAQPNPSYLQGMWQSETFFQTVSSLVHDHFSPRYPLSAEALRWEARIAAEKVSVSVHVRRGDYAADPRFRQSIGMPGSDYYQRAVGELADRFPGLHLFVFSDDPKQAKAGFRSAVPHTFLPETSATRAWEHLILMTRCDHSIIANSTFSWWGAWLNRNPNQVVIAPEQWRRSPDYDCRDATPPKWMRL